MTVIIDPATGLPQLPEGYFFHVHRYDLQIVRQWPDRGWSEWIDFTEQRDQFSHSSLMEAGKYYADLNNLHRVRPQPDAYSDGVKDVEVRTTSRQVTRRVLFIPITDTVPVYEYRYKAEPYERVELNGTYTEDIRANSRVYRNEAEDQLGVPMSKDNLLIRATNLYKHWDALREADQILGKYPPNKLEN